MKLQLAYENILELPNLPTFRERVAYVNSNIFDNKQYMTENENEKITFEDYYNKNSLTERDELEWSQVVERWLGVKRVGSPYKDESVKLTIDFIAGYLLGSKDVSMKHEVHKYKVLQRKKLQNEELSDIETKELKTLNKYIVAYSLLGEELVFMFNDTYERQLKDTLKHIKDEKSRKRIKSSIKKCGLLRIKAMNTSKQIKSLSKKIDKNMIKAKGFYRELKDNKNNESLFSEIVGLIKQTRNTKSKINALEYDLYCLIDDYLQITELQVNYT